MSVGDAFIVGGASLFAGFLLGFLICRAALRYKTLESEMSLKESLTALQARLSEKENAVFRLEGELELLRREEDDLRTENSALKERIAELKTALEMERNGLEEKLRLLDEAEKKLSETFKALSADVLEASSKSFLRQAEETFTRYREGAVHELEIRAKAIDAVVAPLKETLDKFEQTLTDMEKSRVGAYSALTEQIQSLADSERELRKEASNLARALRAPSAKGRWGEIQLKRIVELSGMVEYCDFVVQQSTTQEDRMLRPDMIIRLPGGKNVVVDAKVPIQAYLEAIEISDEERRISKLEEHAAKVRGRVKDLSSKRYWENLRPTPEFVVLFLPGENFFSAALEQDPSLIEFGVDKGVIVATPTTMIALLKTIAYGWRQEEMAKNALEISQLGNTLYERLKTMTSHFANLRVGLHKAVEAYNKTVSSFESRVIVAARKFRELGAASREDIVALEYIDQALIEPRPVNGEEQNPA